MLLDGFHVLKNNKINARKIKRKGNESIKLSKIVQKIVQKIVKKTKA